MGAIASSAPADELHRRSTFHVGGRVGWWPAQYQGGGLALIGIATSSAALGWFEAHAPGASALAHLAVLAVVTGVIRLVRSAALQWLLEGAVRG